MSTTDVISIGDGQFLVQLFAFSDIPDQIDFTRYYEAVCQIALRNGDRVHNECIVHRPSNTRNVAGILISDWLALLLKTDLTPRQLSDADISVVHYGSEVSEQEAMSQWSRSGPPPASPSGRSGCADSIVDGEGITA